METQQIVLQVWRMNPDQTQDSCGYVGEANKGNWPLVASTDQAGKFPNEILAEGAANQYLSYLRVEKPALLPTTKIEQVPVGC